MNSYVAIVPEVTVAAGDVVRAVAAAVGCTGDVAVRSSRRADRDREVRFRGGRLLRPKPVQSVEGLTVAHAAEMIDRQATDDVTVSLKVRAWLNAVSEQVNSGVVPAAWPFTACSVCVVAGDVWPTPAGADVSVRAPVFVSVVGEGCPADVPQFMADVENADGIQKLMSTLNAEFDSVWQLYFCL